MRFVYACISNQCMKPMDEVMKTRKYQKAADLAAKLRIEYLTIDICSSWNRKKPNLESILCEGGHTIVITDVSALGKKDEIADIYQRIIASGNDILICYYNAAGFFEADKLSTVNLDFSKKATFSLAENLQTLSYLSPTAYRVNGGRMVDPQIIEAYWQIELGQLSVSNAIRELGISRSTFERRIDEYVGTDDWIRRYDYELSNTDIGNRPTKLGRISEQAKQFHSYIEANKSEETNYDIPVLASFAGVNIDLWEQYCEASGEEPLPANYRWLYTQYFVLAHHLYREVLRYRKYLVTEKYRSPKK